MEASKRERVEELLNGLANDAHMLSHGRDLVTGEMLSLASTRGLGLTMRNNIYEVWRLVRGTPAASSLEMSAVSSTVGLAQILQDCTGREKEALSYVIKKLGDRMFETGFNWAEPNGIEFSDVRAVMNDMGVTNVIASLSILHGIGGLPEVQEKMVAFGYGMFAYGRNRAANVGA